MVHGAWSIWSLGFSQFEQICKPPHTLVQQDSLTQVSGIKAGRGGSSRTQKVTVDLDVMFKVADLKQERTSTSVPPRAEERALEFLSGLVQGEQSRKQAQERERPLQGHQLSVRNRGRDEKDSRQTITK